MSQQAATITSLAMAFEVVKAMQADGLDWARDIVGLAGKRWRRLSRIRWRPRSIAISTNSKPMIRPIAAMATIGGIFSPNSAACREAKPNPVATIAFYGPDSRRAS